MSEKPKEEPKLDDEVRKCIAEEASGKHNNPITGHPNTCRYSVGYTILSSTREILVDRRTKEFHCPHMSLENTKMSENRRTKWHYRPCNYSAAI